MESTCVESLYLILMALLFCQAISAFLFFSSDIRDSIGDDKDFAKKSGQLWKNLSNEQKEVRPWCISSISFLHLFLDEIGLVFMVVHDGSELLSFAMILKL